MATTVPYNFNADFGGPGIQRGCPPGFGAEFVPLSSQIFGSTFMPLDTPDALGYVVGSDGMLQYSPISTNGVRCLAVADATAEQLAADNAVAWWVDGVNATPSVGSIFGTIGLGLTPVMLLAGGAVLLLLLSRRR